MSTDSRPGVLQSFQNSIMAENRNAENRLTFAIDPNQLESSLTHPAAVPSNDKLAFNMTVNSESIGVQDPHFGSSQPIIDQLDGKIDLFNPIAGHLQAEDSFGMENMPLGLTYGLQSQESKP